MNFCRGVCGRGLFFVFLLLLLLGVNGCGKPQQMARGGVGRYGGSFRLAELGELRSLDPVRIGDTASHLVGTQLYNGLVDFNDAMEIVPAIAASWEVSADGLRYRFHLRAGVCFSDDACFANGKGRTVTAQDFKYSLERVCDPRSLSTGWWLFDGKVAGANAYRAGLSAGHAITGVEGFQVLDDQTFDITLTRPFAPFLHLLTMSYAWVVPREAVEKYGPDFFKHPVGTGPFVLASWEPGLHTLLKRNPHYFEKDADGQTLPYLDAVQIRFLRERAMVFLEFEKGNFEAGGIPPEFWPRVMTAQKTLKPEYAKKYHLRIGPALDVHYIGFMMTQSPLGKNLKLRQAFNYAVDKQGIIDQVQNGRGLAAKGIYPPGIPGYQSGLTGYPFNLAKAKALLAEAGYPAGKGLPEFELQLNASGGSNEEVAAAIQANLAAAGIRIKLKLISWPQHLDAVDRGVPALFRMGWIGDYPDPENFLALLISKNHSPQGPNSTRYSNPQVDALYEQALAEPELKKRLIYYQQAENLVLADAPWLFLSHSESYRLEQPYVQNLPMNPLGRLSFKEVYFNR